VALFFSADVPLKAAEGRESPEFARQLGGYLVTNDELDQGEIAGIVVVSLRNLKQRKVRTFEASDEADYPTVHALSGPDDTGRIAYIEDYFFVAHESDRRHLLKCVHIDGTCDTELFSRPGDAMWALSPAGNGSIGTHIALAPTGGRVAMITHVTARQMPRALLSVGRIEIWDLDDKRGATTRFLALDNAMSWSSDGKRLMYSMLVPRNQLPAGSPGLKEFSNYFGEKWDDVPAIFALNVDRCQSEFVCVGWNAFPADDGRTFLLGGWGDEGYAWLVLDRHTRTTNPVDLPGFATDVIAVRGGAAVYRGSTTTREQLSIKAADLETRAFATLIPQISALSQVSYGVGPGDDNGCLPCPTPDQRADGR
jgi:hypothetical protein